MVQLVQAVGDAGACPIPLCCVSIPACKLGRLATVDIRCTHVHACVSRYGATPIGIGTSLSWRFQTARLAALSSLGRESVP